ncbi:CsbD family protein [Pilimelia columellifera]|uniref:CsbD-like domain-containing protein n=1 Tax=Pilimelia columellifera subsp. columellifera TaxID=706583 RepID=A0ABN3NML5_9ACTN
MGIADRIQDKTDELKGATKEKVGSATDNRDLQAEGAGEKFKGKAGQTMEDIKDAARRAADRHS